MILKHPMGLSQGQKFYQKEIIYLLEWLEDSSTVFCLDFRFTYRGTTWLCRLLGGYRKWGAIL